MSDREQLKIELQQVTQQINQQTQMHSMEVCMLSVSNENIQMSGKYRNWKIEEIPFRLQRFDIVQ